MRLPKDTYEPKRQRFFPYIKERNAVYNGLLYRRTFLQVGMFCRSRSPLYMDVPGLFSKGENQQVVATYTLMVNEHSNGKSTILCRYLPGKIVMFNGHVGLPEGNINMYIKNKNIYI